MMAESTEVSELSIHLKRASDALLRTANQLAALSTEEREREDRWVAALDDLIAMAIELAAMERVLRGITAAEAAVDQRLGGNIAYLRMR
jgi:hypothetical protein